MCHGCRAVDRAKKKRKDKIRLAIKIRKSSRSSNGRRHPDNNNVKGKAQLKKAQRSADDPPAPSDGQTADCRRFAGQLRPEGIIVARSADDLPVTVARNSSSLDFKNTNRMNH